MKFHNETGWPAKLMKNASPRSDRHMMACVIVRRLYEVDGECKLSPKLEADPWPIGPSPQETPLGVMPGDKPFLLGGVDVLLGGEVSAASPTSRLDVELSIGRTFRRRFEVIGDRQWKPSGDGVVATTAKPFQKMRLAFERSFGGSSKVEGQEVPFSANPVGMGYAQSVPEAVGKSLPNIEDANALIATWSDHPLPVGTGYYPAEGSLRTLAAMDHPLTKAAHAANFGSSAERKAAKAYEVEDAELPTADDLRPTLFNHAHPNMVISADKAPVPGDYVSLSAGRLDGSALSFLLPDAPLHLHVQLEDKQFVVPLHLDQIGIIAGVGYVLLSHRTVFEYVLRKGQRRHATLYDGPLPDPIPAAYRRDVKAEWDWRSHPEIDANE